MSRCRGQRRVGAVRLKRGPHDGEHQSGANRDGGLDRPASVDARCVSIRVGGVTLAIAGR